MTTVTPDSRYVITETQSRSVSYTLAELAKFSGLAVESVMAEAAAGRLHLWLVGEAVEEMFAPVVDIDVEYVATPSNGHVVYTVLDPQDPLNCGMPLAEGTRRQLDELLVPGTYQALRYGTGDQIPLVVH